MIKVSCLGPAGSYSELAAKELCPDCERLLCRNFHETIESLVNGASDYAVLPIENSIQGGVVVNLDLVSQYSVFAIKETVLQIDHRLAMLRGVKREDITQVYSHEQAIGQCGTFLREHLPGAKCRYADSTAESLSLLDAHTAGIVGAHVRAEGVELSEENIANEKCNYTRFMLLERRGDLPAHSTKVYFSAVTGHVPGTLAELLQIFARNNVNLTRIESRPLRGKFGQYSFFIELNGNVADPKLIDVLRAARDYCEHFRLIGAYD